MIERVIILDAVDPVAFYGVNNANVQLIKNLFPKVRIAARGNVMKVIGDEKDATSLANLKKSIGIMKKINELRAEVLFAYQVLAASESALSWPGSYVGDLYGTKHRL